MLPALIIGAILVGGCVPTPTKQETQLWSCRNEVYQLVAASGTLFAKTSGGVLAIADGKVQRRASMPPTPPSETIDGEGDGAFLSATTRYEGQLIASFWGGKSVFADENGVLEPLFPRPPAEGDYSLVVLDGTLYAGTNRGLFARSENEWKEIVLGGELPFVRTHGAARIGHRFVVGGIDGVAIGKPGDWNFISREPVRQILQSLNDVWIVYGSGAVDKLAADGRLHSDVLYGTAKRPWTSAVSRGNAGLHFGGMGGWITKGSVLSQEYPKEMSGQVVTAIAEHGGRLFIGTQEKGIACVAKNQLSWINPGNGLADTWVTALASHGKTLYAATATAGLFEIRNGRAIRLATPSEKLRHLSVHNSELIVGALDGAWRRSESTWQKLATDSQETTFLTTIEGRLWVGTPIGVYLIGN